MSLEQSQFQRNVPTDAGPLCQVFINQAALNATYGLTGSNVVSSPILSGGYRTLAVGATSTVAGNISVQRYLDAAGTIPQGPALTAALTANTAGVLNVTDGVPFQSFTVQVTGGGTLSNVGVLFQSR